MHALIDGLDQAVAFQVQLHNGRLVALTADAYDQDTRSIDFQTVGFEQVFYIDVNGRSRAFDPSEALTLRPVWERPDRQAPQGAVIESTVTRTPAEDAAAVRRMMGLPEKPSSAPGALTDVQSSEDRTLLGLGVWAAVILLAVFLVFVLHVPFVFGAVGAYWLGRALSKPEVLASIGETLERQGLRVGR